LDRPPSVLELLLGVDVFFADGGGGGASRSFFTRALDAPDEPASFGRRRRVLCAAVDGARGEPMTMPQARCVLGVDEEERDDDARLSIPRDVQRHGTCGIVSRGVLPAVMWSRTKARVRPRTPHHIFRPTAFLLAGGGPMPSYCASSRLRRWVKNTVH
jgi:hypothetical protein